MHTIVFIVYAGIVAFVSLRPADGGSIEPWDKVVHLLVYYIFAVFGYRAIKGSRAYPAICIGIIAYGGMLEFAQSFTPGRVMSGYDMLANTLGVALGAMVVSRKRNDSGGLE